MGSTHIVPHDHFLFSGRHDRGLVPHHHLREPQRRVRRVHERRLQLGEEEILGKGRTHSNSYTHSYRQTAVVVARMQAAGESNSCYTVAKSSWLIRCVVHVLLIHQVPNTHDSDADDDFMGEDFNWDKLI